MKWTQRVAHAIRTSGRPKSGRLVMPRKEDSMRDYPGAGLTPSRLLAILKEADDGSLAAPMQLFEEMEEKDPHLYSVANTRRLALTGLKWEIVSAADMHDGVDRRSADAAADYCRHILTSLDSLDEALRHLSLAVGRNISIVEIVWESVAGGLRPVDLLPIDFTRIIFDELDRPRILTADAPRDGIPLLPNKFIVHTPHHVAGHPQRGGLLRVTAMVYLAKNLSLKDWMVFAEVFGMPVRIARYEPSATMEEKRELLHMLEALGSNAAGIFSRAVDLQIVDTQQAKGKPPYEHLIDFLNREMSKAWLGQTLTTDISGQSGSVAAARVHADVRQEILRDDLVNEGRTIRRDLLAPLCRMRFGERAPVPHFTRKENKPVDISGVLSVVDAAVNRLGIDVPLDWASRTLGIPQPVGGEPIVSGTSRTHITSD